MEHSVASAAALEKSSDYQHDAAIYAPVGGSRVPKQVLVGIRESIAGIARSCGYPSTLNRKAAREFDARAAEALHRNMAISPHEASAATVWQFMACVMLPHVVRWRFPGRSAVTVPERFLGGPRNTFQRLWWRAEILRDESVAAKPYHLLSRLNEDELVQLMERPMLAGDRMLTRRIASVFLESADPALSRDVLPESRRMVLMRDVQKRIMRLTSILDFAVLNDSELREVIEPAIHDSLKFIRKAPEGSAETQAYDQ
jgi:hypothetical protein